MSIDTKWRSERTRIPTERSAQDCTSFMEIHDRPLAFPFGLPRELNSYRSVNARRLAVRLCALSTAPRPGALKTSTQP